MEINRITRIYLRLVYSAPFALGFASNTRSLLIPTPVVACISPVRFKDRRVPEQNRIQEEGQTIDPALHYNAADKNWAKELAERIRGDRSANRLFATRLAGWDLSGAADVLLDWEKRIRTSRFFGFVVSGRMLQEDWRAQEKLISALAELGLPKGRFLTLLKENVTMPPLLRLQGWIDFRASHRLGESVSDLLEPMSEDLASGVRIPQLSKGNGISETPEFVWTTRPNVLKEPQSIQI